MRVTPAGWPSAGVKVISASWPGKSATALVEKRPGRSASSVAKKRQRLGAEPGAQRAAVDLGGDPDLGVEQIQRLVADRRHDVAAGHAVRGAPAEGQHLARSQQRGGELGQRRRGRGPDRAPRPRAPGASCRPSLPHGTRRSTVNRLGSVVDRGGAEAAVLRDHCHVHRLEKAPGHVVQQLPAAAVVEAGPARHRPGVVELPVERAHAVRLQAAPVFDGGLDGEALLDLGEPDEVREVLGKRK